MTDDVIDIHIERLKAIKPTVKNKYSVSRKVKKHKSKRTRTKEEWLKYDALRHKNLDHKINSRFYTIERDTTILKKLQAQINQYIYYNKNAYSTIVRIGKEHNFFASTINTNPDFTYNFLQGLFIINNYKDKPYLAHTGVFEFDGTTICLNYTGWEKVKVINESKEIEVFKIAVADSPSDVPLKIQALLQQAEEKKKTILKKFGKI